LACSAPTHARAGGQHIQHLAARGGQAADAADRAGRVEADAFWERITYFLDRVVPVANETKVRIACHPHDPRGSRRKATRRRPGARHRGRPQALYLDPGEPYHGLNFCQGTVSEMLQNPGEEIFDVIRYFGERKKIFNVHFRNIKGKRDSFTETFPDNGDINFVRALRVYHDLDYDGMLMPDHVPQATNDPNGLQSFAFAYGHIRGLLQSLEYTG
jgi:mannonate dehydratase